MRMIGTCFAILSAVSIGAGCVSIDAAYAQAPATTLEHSDRGEGDHVVVFESGFGTDASVWAPVVDALDGAVRSITYSRAGSGGSPPADAPRTIEQHKADLSTLLASLGVTENVILVGHPYGGLLSAELARERTDMVVGLVLIDPSAREQRSVFKRADADRIAADDALLLGVMPASMQPQYQLLIDQLDAAEGDVTPLPEDLPVVLFTSTAQFDEPFVFEETPAGRRLWLAMHLDLLSATADSVHVRVPDAGHDIHTEQPERVAAQIARLVDRLRSTSD